MNKNIPKRVIVDSALTLEEVLKQRQEMPAPQEVLQKTKDCRSLLLLF